MPPPPKHPQRAPLKMSDFPGYMNNVGQESLPPGAGFNQVNLESRTPGNLRTRKGMVPVTFATTAKVPLGPDS